MAEDLLLLRPLIEKALLSGSGKQLGSPRRRAFHEPLSLLDSLAQPDSLKRFWKKKLDFLGCRE